MDCAVTTGAAQPGSRPLTGIWTAPVLPSEPRIANPSRQAALTALYLQPVLPELEVALLAVRRQVDDELQPLQPVKLGKPYPLGQCLEIALAVQTRLRTVDESSLPTNAAQGLRALRTFQRAGGDFRQVWGDLRGQYFQNAFQVGTLYIDVANDTVTSTKPKVEILPFDQANFSPVRDFAHFGKIARSYWQHQMYPNHVLPTLAPHCPLIHVTECGQVHMHEATQYMLAMTRSHGFAPSEVALREAPMPAEVFDQVRRALQGGGYHLAASPEQGRQLALQHCRTQRAKRWHQEPRRVSQVIHDVQKINLQLARWHRVNASTDKSTSKQNPMPTLNIDNQTYDLDSLSQDAKANLQMLQATEAEIQRLNLQLAIAQTARLAYANALKAALPSRLG